MNGFNISRARKAYQFIGQVYVANGLHPITSFKVLPDDNSFAYWRAAKMSSFSNSGWSSSIWTLVISAPSISSITFTGQRIPLMHGLPWHIDESMVILSGRSLSFILHFKDTKMHCTFPYTSLSSEQPHLKTHCRFLLIKNVCTGFWLFSQSLRISFFS